MKFFPILTAALFISAVSSSGQFEDGRQGAMDILDNATGKAQDTDNLGDNAELAASFARQLARDHSMDISDIFKMAASATRREDPFGTPLGVPLREVVTSDEDQDQGQGTGGEDGRAAGQGGPALDGFGAAVRGIDIRGVNPGRNEFLSGSDNIFEGDVVDIVAGGGVFRIWIVEVSEDGVTVMDDRSKQTDKIPLTLGIPQPSARAWGAAGRAEQAPPF